MNELFNVFFDKLVVFGNDKVLRPEEKVVENIASAAVDGSALFDDIHGCLLVEVEFEFTRGFGKVHLALYSTAQFARDIVEAVLFYIE